MTDLTGITAPVEPGTVINFKVNYVDPDDHPANYPPSTWSGPAIT